MTRHAYLDASALVKLAVVEKETSALEQYAIACDGLLMSRLGEAELRRAARRVLAQDSLMAGALDAVYLYDVTRAILDLAGQLQPPDLRTGDAIHLATALTLKMHGLDFVTYDPRLARAAAANGLTVVSPGR